MAEIVRRICKNSNIHDPKQVQRIILNTRRHETDSYLDAYLTEDEIVGRLIEDMVEQIGLTEEPCTLFDLIHGHWVNAPVFPDARAFFDQCSAPVYIITNNGFSYMERALQHNGLKAVGVVSAILSGPTNHTGRYLTSPCESVVAHRMRLSTSGIPMTPMWWERAGRGSGRCYFCGVMHGSMTMWMPWMVWSRHWSWFSEKSEVSTGRSKLAEHGIGCAVPLAWAASVVKDCWTIEKIGKGGS